MAMKPNPQCSNAACLERQVTERFFCLSRHLGFLLMLEWIIALQKRYILAKPARDAAAKAKMEAEASAAAADVPLHVDNEWNIRYKSKLLERGWCMLQNFGPKFWKLILFFFWLS